MNVAKVQVVCASCGAPTRIGHQLLEDGRKVRVCRKCKGVLDK
jgi:large subunit ribosomal protein L24